MADSVDTAIRPERVGGPAPSAPALNALVLGSAAGLCCVLVWLRLRDTYLFADDDFVRANLGRWRG